MAKQTDLDYLEIVIVYCNRLFLHLKDINEYDLKEDNYTTVDAARYCIGQIAGGLSKMSMHFIKTNNLIDEHDYHRFCMLKIPYFYADEEIWSIAFDESASLRTFYPRFIEVIEELSVTEDNDDGPKRDEPKNTSASPQKHLPFIHIF